MSLPKPNVKKDKKEVGYETDDVPNLFKLYRYVNSNYDSTDYGVTSCFIIIFSSVVHHLQRHVTR